MDKKPEEKSEKELLLALAKGQKQEAIRSWIMVGLLLVLVTTVLISVSRVMPPLTRTLDQAYTTLDKAYTTLNDTQEMVSQAKESLAGIDTMVENANTLVEDNTDERKETIQKISDIDFEKLNNSIDQLNKVIAPLAKLFSRD